MSVRFRNVDLDVTSDPDAWPFEAILTVIERGMLSDWSRLARSIRVNPWGPCANAVETIASWNENPGVDELLHDLVEDARHQADENARIEFGRSLRGERKSLGMSLREFAPRIGTSPSRLSSYENGVVAPSIAILGRLARLRTTTSKAPSR